MAKPKQKGGKQKGGKPAGNGERSNRTKGDAGRELGPQDRVEAVRPFWSSQPQAERVNLLTVDIQTLLERAKMLTETARQQAAAEIDCEQLDMIAMGLEPTMEEVLEEGVNRLKARSTWKLWTWPLDQKEFTDAEAFRQHITDKQIKEEFRKFLPRDDPKLPERPAEESFRKRMTNLLNRVQQQNQRHFEEINSKFGVGSGGKDKDRNQREKERERQQREQAEKEIQEAANNAAMERDEQRASIYKRRRHHAADAAMITRDTNVELINVMLEALEQENEVLYNTLLLPVTTFIQEVLPEENRDTVKMDLEYQDLDKLMQEDAIQIVEWLTEKVDALSTKLKAEIKEDEEPEDEEAMGDVDLWALTEDGTGLTVNSKWLQHLQERLLGEDGHPRKVKSGEDPHSNGLVLEWVYGSIVSTAEKARDGAKRSLGSYMPMANEAHHALLRALEEQQIWETRLVQARHLLQEMLKSRLEAAELSKQYDIRPVPKTAKPDELPADDSLPDQVLVAMLKREVLLTKAKLHYSLFEHICQDRQLRTWRAQLKQGEPEFERLKRELEEVKHSHRGLDSTYRSQAEMERHRAQLADAAIEEQLEVQTAFREQGALLQGIYNKKERAEYDMARRETEIKQLQGWRSTVEGLIERFTDILAAQAKGEGDEEEGGEASAARIEKIGEDSVWDGGNVGNLSPDKYMQLVKLRSHVHKDVRKQLYGDADDKLFFDNLKTEIKAIEKRMEETRVVVQHLEMQLLNAACDDPGIIIGAQLILPILQERLDQRGKQWAAERARMAESEIIRMEQEQAAREAAERERKRASKAAKKDKVKSEKEKERADREAKEQAELVRKQTEESERKKREDEERRKRQEQLEALRKQEEEYMEARRRELLSDENGYWRQRMRMEEERAAVDAAIMALTEVVDEIPLTSTTPPPQPVVTRRSMPDTTDTHRKRTYAPGPPQQPQTIKRELSGVAESGDAKRAAGPQGGEQDSRGDQGAVKDQQQQQSQAAAPRAAVNTGSASAAAQPPAAAAKPAAPATTPKAAAPAEPAAKVEPKAVSEVPVQPKIVAPVTPVSSSAPLPLVARVVAAGPAPPAAAKAPVPAPAPTPAKPAADPAPPAAPASAPPPAPSTPAIYFGAVPVPVTHPVVTPSVVVPVQRVPVPTAEAAAGKDDKAQAASAESKKAEQALPPPPPPAPVPTAAAAPAAAAAVQQMAPALHQSGGGHAVGNGPMPAGQAAVRQPPPPPPPMPHAVLVPGVVPPGQQGMRQMPGQPMMNGPMQGVMPRPPNQGPPMMGSPGMQGQRMGPGQVPMLPGFPPHLAPPNGMMMPGPNGPGPFIPMMPHQAGHPGMMPQGQIPMHMPMPGHPVPLPPPMQPPAGMALPPQQAGAAQQPAVPHSPGHAQPEQETPKADGQGAAPPKSDKALNAAAKPFVPSFGVKSPAAQQGPPQAQQKPAQSMPAQPQQPLPQHPPAMNGHVNTMLYPMPMQAQQQGMMGMMPGSQQYGMPYPGMQQPGARGPNMPGPARTEQRRQSARQVPPSPMQGLSHPQQPPMQGPPGQPFVMLPNGMPVDPRTSIMMGHPLPPQGMPHQLPHLIPMSMHPGMPPVMMPPHHMPPMQQAPAPAGAPPAPAKPQHAEAQIPLSPDGPLDQSQNTSDNSSASEDSQAPAQQSTAEQDAQQIAMQGSAAPLPAADTQPQAQPQESDTQSVVSTQTAQSAGSAGQAASAGPAPASRSSWSAVAARERSGSDAASGASPARPSQAPSASSATSQQGQSAQSNVSWKDRLQQSMPPEPRPQWVGTPPVGNFLASATKQHAQHKLHVTETGAVMYQGPGQDNRSLQLVRGLRNGEGEYNCFLNVIIQSLWSLRVFRQAMLGIQPVRDGGADAQVLAALYNIFKAMAAKPGSAPVAGGAQGSRTVSPAELRTALAALDSGQASVRVEQSDMHDAAEVLTQILECMHSAEANASLPPGSPAVPDITLPVRVKPGAPCRSAAPMSMVHRLFGLDVQQPCPVAESEEESRKNAQRNARGNSQTSNGPQPSNSSSNSAGGGNTGGDLQFTKFSHLVPAQGLRQAYADALPPSGIPNCAWEELLAAVEAASTGHPKSQGERAQPTSQLLRRPKVFSLALVWESPQVPTDAVRGTLSALGPALEVPALFRIPKEAQALWPPGLGSTYTLRAVICYFGHHYVAFVLSEELKMWLSFDDADISVVGEWPDVCCSMLARRMQPSLLIYEDVPPAQI